MATPPANPFDSALQNVRRVGVYVAAEPDVRPTIEDYRPDVLCTSIRRYAGSKLASADFTVNLPEAQKNIENREVISNASRQVEVWLLKETVKSQSESVRDECLFWGELLTDRITIDANQNEQWTAMIGLHHFGEPVEGQLVYDKPNDDTAVIHYDLEFNPELDGIVKGNMWPTSIENNPAEHPIWIDPESYRTQAASDFVGGDGELWTLPDIIEALSVWKNNDETYVENILRDKLDQIFTDAPDIVNVILTSGGYLPEYFDALLQTYGYNWFASTFTDDGATSISKLNIFQRGEGTRKTIKLQEFGSDYAPTKDEAELVDVEYQFALSKNRYRVQGALIEREFTLELYRAWEADDDGNEDHQDANEPIGRKWIANEGGSYKDLRTEITDPPDLGSTFGVPKNRVMEDCLTLRDGQRRPVFVEYRENTSSDWKDLNQLTSSWRVLTTEVGIYFTGTVAEGTGAIPDEMLTEDVELRITGTLKGDFRIENRTAKSSDSPISSEVERVVRAHDQFFDRQRQATGDFASELLSVTEADERDDTSEIAIYAGKVLENETPAVISAAIRLFGLHLEYEIGDVLTEVDGRGISLNRAAGPDTPRYVQVVGIVYNITPNRSTELIVSQYDII